MQQATIPSQSTSGQYLLVATAASRLVILSLFSSLVPTSDAQILGSFIDTETTQYNQQVQAQQPQSLLNGLFAPKNPFRRERVSWCTTSLIERKKCLDWARAIEDVNIQFEGREPFKLNLDCTLGADKDQCMSMIDDERADLILLDPGEIGVAGRYHSLSPIMVEMYTSSGGSSGPTPSSGHYSVAVVKKRSSSSIQQLSDLFGKRACFSGVSHMASWTLPLASLIDLPSFEIADCNNLVKSASYFFGNSCAPNSLINKFNPTGDNPQKMSQLCERHGGRVGAHSEPASGTFSAIKCLADPIALSPNMASMVGSSLASNRFAINDPFKASSGSQANGGTVGSESADVAFVQHNTIFLAEKLNLPRELRLEVPSRNELELLCPQGGRAPLDRWQTCNFGFVPANAVIVSSRVSAERREAIQKFLKTSVQLFSGTSTATGAISSSVLYGNSLANPTLGSTSRQAEFEAANVGSTQQLGNNRLSQQQAQQQPLSPLSPFDFGYPEPQQSSAGFTNANSYQRQQQNLDPSSQVRNSPPTSLATTPMATKLNTNFKLTGDYSLINYPSLDVLFSSDMIDLVPLVGAAQTFKGFLNSFPIQLATTSANSPTQQSSQPAKSGQAGDYYYSSFFSSAPRPEGPLVNNHNFDMKTQTDYFEKLRRCPVPAAILCVTSDKEFNKCQAMSKAFHAAGLKPELNCKLAHSTMACIQLIKNRDADLVVLDAADIYLAGAKFGLRPIVAEQIEMYESSYYAVAVAKKSDQSTDLFNLKSKNSCHSGYLKAAGWIMPINFLLSNNKIRKYDDCNSARSTSGHFDKSCAPGILASVSNIQSDSSWTIRNMCELCHGTGRGYCAPDASEPFFGDTGSFRCLVEGGGQVAFLRHNALFQNTGGSNRETWARNLIKEDFELLCRDGSRAKVNDYKSCNLGTVPPNAIATRGDTPFRLIDAYVNLFMYGQQYYGSKYTEEYTFKMFSSTNGKDLIFQDATQQLVRVPIENQTYNSYLNHEFLRAMDTVFCGV